ncbi:cytochrome C oxidase subunit IV family protein [candidate division KSB1 bacterium]|nr:cytochrome C oxidase subunit IV family protein [candidate division KSB1 bacterium]NIR69315.1 cytochrome C oxidase subunit IV family protein [candidate division KSB1 bacterium]NIS22721.1 cytochrome C oxidase subunit IV family protein [candidate division KSB1 bacterium]NIT69567.1 cytochrome C oxidase subunit IV family protein [candidate division KSB1 bacterium]NIU23221.1 cytochrome C oxidase subunit IV family protein [candidate division KSB1 bacterium]
MSGDHQEPNYMAVFYWLAILTAFEVGVAYLNVFWEGFPLVVLGLVLIILALAKACLVAMYFMHLKFEKRTLGVIALTPLLLCTLLIVSLLPDLTGTTREKASAEAKIETVERIADTNDQTEELESH